MKRKTKVSRNFGRTLKKATPTLLTCMGAAGVIATAALAIKATIEASKVIEEERCARTEKNYCSDEPLTCICFTKQDIVTLTWKCYIPAAATGAATIACIFGANILNHRQQATLASAYALVSRSYNDYKRKVKELYGKEAHEKIIESLAVEKAKEVHLQNSGLANVLSLDFEDIDEEPRLFYDNFSNRLFQSTFSKVLQAEYHLNRNFALMGGFVPLNMFYEFLGLEPMEKFAELGWWVDDDLYWIDFDHGKSVVDDGLNGEVECYVIDMAYVPTDALLD